MKFNYALEKRNHDMKWKRLYKEYKKVGMSDEAIEIMKEFDWEQFKKQRTFCRHNQYLPEEEYDDGNNSLTVKFEEAFTYEDKYLENERYAWVEELDSEEVIMAVKSLTDTKIEIITQYVFEQRSQSEIAKKLGISQSALAQQIGTIKKNIKKFQ